MGEKRKRKNKNKKTQLWVSYSEDREPFFSSHESYGSIEDLSSSRDQINPGQRCTAKKTKKAKRKHSSNQPSAQFVPDACAECLQYRDPDRNQGPCVHTAGLTSHAETKCSASATKRLRKVQPYKSSGVACEIYFCFLSIETYST